MCPDGSTLSHKLINADWQFAWQVAGELVILDISCHKPGGRQLCCYMLELLGQTVSRLQAEFPAGDARDNLHVFDCSHVRWAYSCASKGYWYGWCV